MGKIKKNFIYLSLYKILEMLLPLVTSPILSRRLGAEALGAYSYTYSVAIIFTTIAQLGIYNYGMREIAKIRDDKNKLNQVYSNLFSVHMIVSILVLAIYLLSILVFFRTNQVLFLIQTFILFSIMLDNSFLFVGLEEIKVVTIRDLIFKLVTFILIILLINQPSDLYLYCSIMAVSSFLSKLITFCYAKKYITLIKPNWNESKKHFKPMALLMIPVLAGSIYQVLDKIMLEWIYGEASVGYYECASKALIPRNIITVLGTVLCPRISNLLASNKKNEAISDIKRSLCVSLILSYIFTFGIITIAKDFAPWFWGEDFKECSKMIIGLSISIPIWSVGEVIRNQYLLPSGRDKEFTLSFIIGVLSNVVLNCIFIPLFGVMGAILATIISEIIMSAIQYFISRKDLCFGVDIYKTLPYFIISLVVTIITKKIITYINVNLTYIILIEILTWGVAYIILVIAYEQISKDKIITNLVLTRFKNKA